MNNTINVPISIGELFDKYTILQIKSEKLKNDATKIESIHKELNYLQKHIDNICVSKKLLENLKKVNEELWDIEDKIREKEKLNVFDDEFILLARSVYKTNDLRSRIKYDINRETNSDIIEIKSYYAY